MKKLIALLSALTLLISLLPVSAAAEEAPAAGNPGEAVTDTVAAPEGEAQEDFTLPDEGEEEEPAESSAVPTETPEVPDETPEVPTETPEVPDETHEVPTEIPEVPEETPEEETEPPKDVCERFEDVSTTDWFAPYVQQAVDAGFMTGIEKTTFAPRVTTSRAMLVQILYAMEGKPSVEGYENPFDDVSDSRWYHDAVVWAYANSVTAGISDTEFGPDRAVTREQAALLLYAYVNRPEMEGKLTAFQDGDSTSLWARSAMLWASQNGILAGSSDQNGCRWLNPGNAATRAEISAIMVAFQNYMNTVGKADSSQQLQDQVISWNTDWTYASYSAIHASSVTLYRSHAENRNGIVVAVNAGHGTSGGSSVKTLCHPDGSAKVTGGSTAAGAVKATAISEGTVLGDGTEEAAANLSLALILKEKLLAAGYDVLMLRETGDTRLDNIARTVFANQNADCHMSIHYDSTTSNKGLFVISVPENKTYRSMEPVASHWQEHMAFAQALLSGEKSVGVKIYSTGLVPIDLTQTSYSTIPSVDVEVGDEASDHSAAAQSKIADGLVAGVQSYFAS